MTTLITGGMGFIGLHTAKAFLDQGEDLVITQFRARREPDFIKDEIGNRVQVETLDVSDGEAVKAVLARHKVDGIVHLAVPGLGALQPAEEVRVNILGLVNMLEAVREANLRRISIASSIGVYGALTTDGPFVETMGLPTNSSNPTDAFKKAEEIIGLHYADRTGIDLVALRIGGIWGPLYHSMANLPSRVAHAAVHGTELSYGGPRGGVPYDEDGSDMCYVKDCAKGIQLAHMTEKLNHRVYNVASGRETKNREVLEAARRVVPETDGKFNPGAGPRHRENAYLDITRLKEDTGYQPQWDVYSGMADYIQWLRHNPQ